MTKKKSPIYHLIIWAMAKNSKMNILTNEQIDQLMTNASIIDDYLLLFKSCTTVISRDYVMQNARRELDNEDYIIFLKFCYDHLNDVHGPKPEKKVIPDEPFTY
jgi:hypothetical protein